MSSTALSVVPHAELTPGQRAKAQFAAAQAEGREIVSTFAERLAQMAAEAEEIADLGEIVPAGVRDRARRLVETLKGESHGFTAIISR